MLLICILYNQFNFPLTNVSSAIMAQGELVREARVFNRMFVRDKLVDAHFLYWHNHGCFKIYILNTQRKNNGIIIKYMYYSI